MIKNLKRLFATSVFVVLIFGPVPAALADQGAEPVGSCPPGFELHHIQDHDQHHYRYIGTETDQNGDGYLCVKDLGDKHLHIDNNLPN